MEQKKVEPRAKLNNTKKKKKKKKIQGFIFFYKGFIFFYTKNYVKTKSYRCAYMGRPPLVVRQMRGMKRKAVKGAGLFAAGLESCGNSSAERVKYQGRGSLSK